MFAGGISTVEADGHGIHAAENFHEVGFAFHDAEAARRRDVAIAEHARGVRGYGHDVAAPGQIVGQFLAVADAGGNG